MMTLQQIQESFEYVSRFADLAIYCVSNLYLKTRVLKGCNANPSYKLTSTRTKEDKTWPSMHNIIHTISGMISKTLEMVKHEIWSTKTVTVKFIDTMWGQCPNLFCRCH